MTFKGLHNNVGIYFNHKTRGYDCDYSHDHSFKTEKEVKAFIEMCQAKIEKEISEKEYDFYFKKNKNGTTDIMNKEKTLLKTVDTRAFFRGEIDNYDNFTWV